MQLPDAYLKDDRSLNKLSYYEKAASDSARLEEQLKNDPYYLGHGGTVTEGLHKNSDTGVFSMKYRQNMLNTNTGLNTSPYNTSAYSDPNEAKVYEKLNELNRAMDGATLPSNQKKNYSTISRSNQISVNSADIERLEGLMNRSRNGEGDEDAEMKQLNTVMDKILDIQHPERVKVKIKQKTEVEKGQVYAVTAHSNRDNTSLLLNSRSVSNDTFRNNDITANGFFSLVDDIEANTEQANALQAVIHETQSVVDGAIVKLLLINDILVNGNIVPKGSFVFGTASLNGERLNIRINSLRYKSFLFPVQLIAFVMDGMEGVYVPGTITKDVVGNSAERAVQGIGISTLNPSIGGQAASAGIEAAKTLLKRKAKLIKVTLKAGYQVLLRNEKQRASD